MPKSSTTAPSPRTLSTSASRSYPSEWSLSASRFHVEAELEAPAGSFVVFWAPYYDPKSPDEHDHLAIDPLDQVYYPIVCDYADGAASKVLVVRDPVAGVAMLQSPDAIYSVTFGLGRIQASC
ncbi:hypothetical protein LZ30DRAFT_778026 [Colletotrichum cereale]|nr:hypothetical protein LZ30DRAFT_778026 [Colletotrichum cereale]